MKFTTRVALASSALLALASAQVSYDNATDTWTCPIANGSYCAGDSLSTPVVILCTNGKGVPGNCIPHNWNRPPANVYYSPCYQSSPEAGDAACAKNCVVYPDTGLPFDVPGTCNASYFDSIDVTGGDVTTTCQTGLAPYSNVTTTFCNATLPSNSTHSSNSTNGTSSHTSTPSGTTGGPSSTGSSAAGASTSKAAAAMFGAAPVAGYVVLGLAALAL